MAFVTESPVEVSAEVAVKVVKPGDRVFVGTACATPRMLVQALEGRAVELGGVTLVHGLTDGVTGERGTSGFVHRVSFVGSDVRRLRPERLDYVPIAAAQIPELWRSAKAPIDVALVQVSPPDDEGWCSLGVSVDITRTAIDIARVVVAELNPSMPRTHGDSWVHMSRFQHVVTVDGPVIEYVHPPVGEVAERIARYIARLVDDGAALQIGLGRIPNEMVRYLTNRRDLRVHSDVITDSLLDLLDADAVSSEQPVVASFAMGTRRLYDRLASPRFSFRRIEDVVAPDVLAEIPGLVSVTQAFAVDLTGQVSADWLDGAPYGGVATQPDCHEGARRSPGGRAVVCLASTFADGSSAIRSQLSPGEAVAVTRADVHWVVTEFGAAYLYARSLRERAVALIEIAHPDHRERLLAEAKIAGLVPEGQKMRSRVAYPDDERSTTTLKDGRAVEIRPTTTSDAAALQELFFRMRPEDVYTRFFRKLRSLTLDMAEHLCSVGYEQEMAFVAVVGDADNQRALGTASYYVDQSTRYADVAYIVDPEYQGSGLGTALQALIVDYAKRHGVLGFTADVLEENQPMLAVMRRSGTAVEESIEEGCYSVRMRF